MKTLVFLIVAVATFNAVFAQNGKQVQDLPELEEWFSMSSGYGISYLPNFDVANGGINATALNLRGTATIYNRFHGDTVNQFSWERASLVVYGDFNNDGLRDYVDVGGRLYLGVGANAPPKQTGKKILDRDLWYERQGTVVNDFTGDGIDDIITRGKSIPDSINTDGYLIMGNADTSRIHSVSFKFPGTKRCLMIAAYTIGGKGRIISYGYGDGIFDRNEGFYLWSIEVEKTGEPTVKLALLDKVERFKLPGAELFYTYYNSGLVKVSEQNIAFLAVKTSTSSIYRMANDKFEFQYENYAREGDFQFLERAIDRSGKPGWSRLSLFGKWIVFYSGSPADDTIAKAVFPGFYQTDRLAERIVSIGDINGDEAGDVAMTFSGRSGRSFVIAKGITSTSVAEQAQAPFRLTQSIPSPVPASSQGVISVSLERSGQYSLTLYSLQGNEIGRVFSGELSAGEHQFVIEPKRYGLAPGFYSLRLSDGVRTRERGFMVEGR